MFDPSVPDSGTHNPDPKKKDASLPNGHASCPADEQRPVGFSSMAIPIIEAKYKPPSSALETEEPSHAEQPSVHEDRKADSNVGTPFDAHAAGWEVVDAESKTASESTSDHSDVTEDKSKTHKRSTQRKRGHLPGKNAVPPQVHPDDFEDPISDEFWEGIWVACAKHNVGDGLISCMI